MDNLSVKLPKPLKRRLTERARRARRSASDLAREWIERALDQGHQPSCHDLMKPACGHFGGDPKGSSQEGFDD